MLSGAPGEVPLSRRNDREEGSVLFAFLEDRLLCEGAVAADDDALEALLQHGQELVESLGGAGRRFGVAGSVDDPQALLCARWS